MYNGQEIILNAKKVLSFKEFIEEKDVTNSLVKILGFDTYYKEGLMKVVDGLGFINIYYTENIYAKKGVRYVKEDTQSFSQLLCFSNPEKNIALIQSSIDKRISTIISNYFQDKGYDVIYSANITEEMRDEYCNLYVDMVDKKYESFTEEENYKYDSIQDYNREGYVNKVTKEYMTSTKVPGIIMTPISVRGCRGIDVDISEMNIDVDFNNPNQMLLKGYLLGLFTISDILDRTFHREFAILDLANVDLLNNLRIELYANPTDEMIKLKNICLAITQDNIGLSLNVKAINEEGLQVVKNEIVLSCNNFAFLTIQGRKSVKIEEIEYIKFKGKVIWENK